MVEKKVNDEIINRNHIIYSYQKNRNPFIDHPEFVGKIWKIEDLKISNEATENKASGNGAKYFVVLALLILGILFFVRVLKKIVLPGDLHSKSFA